MLRRATLLAGVLAAYAAAVLAAEPGLVAHYTFEEAAGTVLKDHSGNGYDGTIHNADWVALGQGHALKFKSTQSYVDCGLKLARKLAADMTILAWVKLGPASYPDRGTNWTLLECEVYPMSGFIVRIDGATAKLVYRASSAGRATDVRGQADIARNAYHHLAVTRQGNRVMLLVDGWPDASITIQTPTAPWLPLRISSPDQSLDGAIDELAIYDRAMAQDEILDRYKKEAAAHAKDTSWFGTFRLEPLLYPDRGKAGVGVNYRGVLPVPPGAKAVVELGEPCRPSLQTVSIGLTDDPPERDITFDLASLAGRPAREYEIRAVLRDAAGKTIARKAVCIRWPPARPVVPSPAQKTLPPLPAVPKPLPFTVTTDAAGGFTIRAGGQSFSVTSEFSYPGGGFNVLGQSSMPDSPSEPAWKPAWDETGPSTYRIAASVKHYDLSRRIEVQPGRVVVHDTIANRTAEPLGILVRNRIAAPIGAFKELYVAGCPSSGNLSPRGIKTNPTIFLGREGRGLGLIALDDVFIVQSMAAVQDGAATLQSDTFALDRNASYTLDWAIYPTSSGDYYDFINQVRRDEGRNGTVDGGLGFITHSPSDRRGIPERRSVELRNIKYGLVHCLSYAADDPGVSIEGIEFMDYPKERRLLKEQFAAIHRAYPGMKIVVHVAHSLWATNRPEQVFPDSRVIDAGGRQTVFTTDPGSYFSKERLAQGWNWYIYYPTLDNSYGRAMLKSVDVLMDEIGADGPFMDGFMWPYGGDYTYDRWDGHTAQIDPKTKTIVRKMGSVLLLSQDALAAFCRKVRGKGGVVIANNSVITRTIGRETYIIHDIECYPGPQLHLASTPLCLSLPAAIHSEPDIHRDMLDKLAWGNLYGYYEECPLTHPSVPAQMYPITFEAIHSGWVQGTQRLITMRSGLYGWLGDRQLHFVYLYDSRGVQIPHDFLTTVDSAGVRTQVDLGRQQCAVVKKIPITIESAGPANVHVGKYDGHAIELVANAGRPARLTIRGGEFPVRPGSEYLVAVDGRHTRVAADGAGSLAISLEPAGQLEIRVTPAPVR